MKKIILYFIKNFILDPVIIFENYPKVKGGLPPGLKYEFVYKNNLIIENKKRERSRSIRRSNNDSTAENKIRERSRSVRRLNNSSASVVENKSYSKEMSLSDYIELNKFTQRRPPAPTRRINIDSEAENKIRNRPMFLNNVSTIENKIKSCYVLTQSLSNNLFLKIVLNGRNQQWQKKLFDKLQEQENLSITFDETNFKISSNIVLDESYRDWEYKIDYLIGEYLEVQFKKEIIEYKREQYAEIRKMIEKLEETRKLYPIDYFHKADSISLYLMGQYI